MDGVEEWRIKLSQLSTKLWLKVKLKLSLAIDAVDITLSMTIMGASGNSAFTFTYVTNWNDNCYYSLSLLQCFR